MYFIYCVMSFIAVLHKREREKKRDAQVGKENREREAGRRNKDRRRFSLIRKSAHNISVSEMEMFRVSSAQVK